MKNSLLGPLILAALFHVGLLWNWSFNINSNDTKKDQVVNISLMPYSKADILNSPQSQLESISKKINSELNGVKPYKKKTISEAYHSINEADYLQRWQSLVEQVGNQYYPQNALQKNINGQLRLLVSVKKDGSINKINIMKSSGYKILDNAAIDIVRQAAPFEPFPSDFQDLDELEIIRTWDFRGHLFTTT